MTDPSSSIKEPVTQASEEAMKRIDAWYAIGLLDIETADDPDFVRAVEAYGHECSRQALGRAAQKMDYNADVAERMRLQMATTEHQAIHARRAQLYREVAASIRALIPGEK